MLRTLQHWNQDYRSFGDGMRLVTIDVIGLYTNIPHQDLLTLTYPTRTSSHQHTPPGPPPTIIPHQDLSPGPPHTNIPHQDLLTQAYPTRTSSHKHTPPGPLTRTSSHQHTPPGPPHINIPHQDLLTALRFHLNSMPQTNIPPTERVADIANHVLSSNVFSFEDDYFQQIFGTAMGTPMAPSAPNLFMGWLEAQLLASSPVPVSQDTWKRFIDDIFLLWIWMCSSNTCLI